MEYILAVASALAIAIIFWVYAVNYTKKQDKKESEEIQKAARPAEPPIRKDKAARPAEPPIRK